MKLVTVDMKKTMIAEFHSAPKNQIEKSQARLEVPPEGMDMLEYIILTFVIAEKKRRQREGGQRRGLALANAIRSFFVVMYELETPLTFSTL